MASPFFMANTDTKPKTYHPDETAQKLLRKFKSVINIKKAIEEELQSVIGKQKTKLLVEFFGKKDWGGMNNFMVKWLYCYSVRRRLLPPSLYPFRLLPDYYKYYPSLLDKLAT